MSPDQIATVVIVVLQSGALAMAFKKITDGLKTKIVVLEETVKAQNVSMGSISKSITLMDDVNDRYIGRLKKLEEHFDICIRDLEHIKDRQLKARDDEAQWLLSENVALKNELHKVPREKPSGRSFFVTPVESKSLETKKSA